MLLSNKLTLCLTFFILLAFIAVPVMAHQPPPGQTYAEAHDGVSDSQDPDAQDALAAETGHSHRETAPMVSSITAEDITGAVGTAGGDLVSSVDGRKIALVNDADGADGARLVIALAGADATSKPPTPNTLAAGEFVLKITFTEDVYTSAPTDANTAPVFAVDDLVADDITLIAAAADNPNLNIGVGGSDSNFLISSVARLDTTPDDDTDNPASLSKTEFLVTVTVSAGLTEAQTPVSIWINVAADQVFSPTQLINGRVIQGRGNAAYETPGATPFSLDGYMALTTPSTPDDTAGPNIVSFTSSAADSDGNVTFTLTFDEALGTSGLIPADLTITGGTLVTTGGITPAGSATVYMVKVTPNDDPTEAEVTVRLNNGSVSDKVDGARYVEPMDNVMIGRYDTVNPTVNAVATGVVGTGTGTTGNGIAVGMVKLSVTFSEELASSTDFANADIDRTNSNVLLTNTNPMLATMPEGNKTVWELTVTPVPANAAQVVIVITAGSVMDKAGNPLLLDTIVTWTHSTTADTTKPVIMLQNPKGADADDDDESVDDDVLIDESGGSITFTIVEEGGLAADAAVAMSEVSVSNGTVVSVVDNTITVNPMVVNGATVNTSVTVTVAAGAIADAAGNMNDAVSATYGIGPIFSIPMNTILVITKTAGATHTYLSDQPRLPLDQAPPTPAEQIETAIWSNMPDLEVLFSFAAGGNGGTLNLIEAHRQGELGQSRDGGNDQHQSVRISEVMWASDLRYRGAQNDAEAAEQWVEITNNTGSAVRVLLYARTGLDSAVNIDDNAEDRVGNAYNGGRGSGGWNIAEAGSGKGQNGNSWTGVNFVSMHRKWDGAHNRGYVNGTSSGNWSASDREYLTLVSDNGEKLYDHVGSPGRPHSIGLPRPNTKADSTAVPSNKVIINEVANRDANNSAYEWIELRAPGGEVNLRKYVISMVTGVNKDTVLIDFPNDDKAKIPAGGVLLILASDPRFDEDHPIAVGYNVDEPEADQVAGLGLNVANSPRAPAKYKVINFQNGGLPNDGNFLLIVRRPDNASKNDGPELGADDRDKIEDIAGYHTGLDAGDSGDVEYPDGYPATNPKNLNTTGMWPLVNAPRPGFGHNKFDVNQVHYRHRQTTNKGYGGTRAHDDKGGVAEAAYIDPGYSGIGYKRWVRDIGGIHHGTPGYHGNTVNDVANSSVTISEIMYSTGANGALPQWIELYNSSATKAVHLGSGWRFVIETLDADGNALTHLLTISFKDKGSVKYIYPQQTVLVAAGNARQAGSDFQPASVVFPDNRLFNVNREYRGGALKSGDEFANDQYMFFNPKAFHIALIDKDGKLVDQVGNLDGDSRTNDTVTAENEFPSAVAEDGVRSSIIRIYDKGTARDGMGGIVPMPSVANARDVKRLDKNNDGNDKGMGIDPKYSWIPAVNTDTDFRITIRSTWYGHENDYGTPGYRRGLVLPVELSSFRPTLEDGVVTVRWTTESELDNAGFNIYRSETREGEYKQVNTELIEGAGTTGERSNYSWVDQTAKPGVVYYYQIEDVSFAGDREALAITKLKGLISAKNKLTTTWSELKEASQ